MKKSTLLVGVTSSILVLIGVAFKSQHWPLAGALITLGVAFFALGYAILLFIDKNKIAQSTIDKFANVMTMVTMIVVTVGFLFKTQHWAGAGVLIYVAHLVLLAMVAVLYVQGSKETEPVKKLHYNNMAIVLTIITAISLYIWWRTRAPGSL
jgi:hypothetical protein